MPTPSNKSKSASASGSKKKATTGAAASRRSRKPSTKNTPDSSMEKDEILEQGRQAAELLSSPVYNRAHRMVLDQIVEQWLQSEESETQKRENLYLKAQCLGETAAMLLVAVNEAQQLNLSDEERAEEELKAYLEEQGFGLMDQSPH